MLGQFIFMIQQSIKKVVAVVFFFAVLTQHGFAEFRHKLQATSEIYADLRNDAYGMKLIDAWLILYQTVGASMEQKGDKDALRWLAKQEKQDPAKVAQMGLEILKREQDLDCKAFMLGEMSCLHNTVKAPLIEEIHNQLQQLPRKENGEIRSDGYALLQMSASVLARIGAESDEQILLSLTRGCPEMLQTKVAKQIKELDDRLAKEKANSRPSAMRQGLVDIKYFFFCRWTWIIGGGLVLLGGILFLARGRRPSGGL